VWSFATVATNTTHVATTHPDRLIVAAAHRSGTGGATVRR
jgi:hypothetical protein